MLGTDGFGRGDYRRALRCFFEVDRHCLTVATLKALADEGSVEVALVHDAIRRYEIDPGTPIPPPSDGIGRSRTNAQPRRCPMARRVLVLSSEELADANEVPPAIRPLIDEAEEVYVVAPTLTSWMQWLTDDRDKALASADERLRTVFDHMRAGGLKPRGEVGAEDQVAAITDALAQFDADLIVLRLHAPGSEHENRREQGIAEKVRSHFDVPTIVFYFDDEGQVVEREET